jgi:hypothetical protein
MELERDAFRSQNGEFGWTRAHAILAIEVLHRHDMAILGGEVWWVKEDGLIRTSLPQRQGPPALYIWSNDRQPGELWTRFVERGASEAFAHVQRKPKPEDIPPDLTGRILYCLAWVSEAEFEKLRPETHPWWKFWARHRSQSQSSKLVP